MVAKQALGGGDEAGSTNWFTKPEVASEIEVGCRQAVDARQPDDDAGVEVGVDARFDPDVITVHHIVHLPGTGDGLGTNEVEGIISHGLEVGVHQAELDRVVAILVEVADGDEADPGVAVGFRIADDEHVVARVAEELVILEDPDAVIAGPAEHRVDTRIAGADVFPVAAEHDVVFGTGLDPVVTGIARHAVVARVAEDLVVAIAPGEAVVTRPTP